jgi:dihydrodipicolinate reductase
MRETITIKHVAHSRRLSRLARGRSVVVKKQPGLYSMKDVLAGV